MTWTDIMAVVVVMLLLFFFGAAFGVKAGWKWAVLEERAWMRTIYRIRYQFAPRCPTCGNSAVPEPLPPEMPS